MPRPLDKCTVLRSCGITDDHRGPTLSDGQNIERQGLSATDILLSNATVSLSDQVPTPADHVALQFHARGRFVQRSQECPAGTYPQRFRLWFQSHGVWCALAPGPSLRSDPSEAVPPSVRYTNKTPGTQKPSFFTPGLRLSRWSTRQLGCMAREEPTAGFCEFGGHEVP